MTNEFKEAWLSYIVFRDNFFGNYRSNDYKSLAKQMVNKFKKQGCLMSVKLHYVDAHLDKFPQNCGHQGEQQGERGHQDAKPIERRHQGKKDVRFLADYNWLLKLETNICEARKQNRNLFKSYKY